LIGLSLRRFDGAIGRIYGADLVAAGLGAASILGALYLLFPITALTLVTAVALIACWIALLETRAPRAAWWGSLAALATASVWFLPTVTHLAMTPYKGLPQTLLIPGTRVIDETSSPLGLISVVESADVPFRYAPGMSLSAIAEIPPQRGVFSDGDGFSPITRYTD